MFDKPERHGDHAVTVLARKHPDTPPRLGLAIAKRAIRHASARNRIKRLVRESFRHAQADLDGFDLVVMVRTAAETLDNADLRRRLDRTFARIASGQPGRSGKGRPRRRRKP